MDDKHLRFPRTINRKKWEKYLDRNLFRNELEILSNMRMEYGINEDLKELHNQCKNKGLFIPILTELDGNCMFESLSYHNLGQNAKTIRTGIAYLMHIFRDYKNFLPNVSLSLKEWFNLTNEVEHVYSRDKFTKEKKFHKYTYDIMCKDLSNMNSWSKLPTELILRVISYLFDLDINIIHNNGHTTVINVYKDLDDNSEIPELKKIYLGHLGESHYVPIDIIKNNNNVQPIFYDKAYIKFTIWANKMQEEKIKMFKYKERLRKLREEFKKYDSDSSSEDHINNGSNLSNNVDDFEDFSMINDDNTTNQEMVDYSNNKD